MIAGKAFVRKKGEQQLSLWRGGALARREEKIEKESYSIQRGKKKIRLFCI